MRRVAGPQDDDWNADSHERWTKCCDLAMLLVFLVAVVAVPWVRGVPRLSACLFVCGIYAGVYMRLSVCLFVCGMYVEFDPVATARLCRVSHKKRISANPAALISAFTARRRDDVAPQVLRHRPVQTARQVPTYSR